MYTFSKALAILAPFAFASAVTTALAQTPSTMTCTSGGVATLTLPITGISFDLPTGSPMGYFTVTAPFSEFNYLAYAHFDTPNFDVCSFAPGNGTYLVALSISDVSAHADASAQYTQLTLSYNQIGIGSPSAATAVAKPKVPLTAEQQQKFLSDYLARLPKPTTVSK